MKRKQILTGLVVAIISTLILAGGGSARADGDEQKVRGPVTVDVAAQTVTIGGVTLQVTNGTRIEVGDRRATLGDLAAFVSQNPGAQGEAEFFDLSGQLVAKEIKVEAEGDDNDNENENENEAEIHGTLVAVNAAAGTVTIQPQDGSPPLVLTLTAASRIEIDDADVTLAQLVAILPPGQPVPVEVEFDATTNVVKKLEVEEELENEDQDVIERMRQGAGGTTLITVRHGSSGKHSKTSTFTVLPGSVITTPTSIITVRDLRNGDILRLGSFAGRGRQRFAPKVELVHRHKGR